MKNIRKLVWKWQMAPTMVWHILAWSFYALYFMGLFRLFDAASDYIENYVLYMLMNMGLFYAHAYWVVPVFAIEKPLSWMKFFGWMVLEFLFFSGIYLGISIVLGSLKINWDMTALRFDIHHWDPFIQPFLFIICASSLYRLISHFFRAVLYGHRLEKELAYEQALGLRRKIGVHSVFNPLAILYMKISKGDYNVLPHVLALQRSLSYRLNDSYKPQPLGVELDIIIEEMAVTAKGGRQPLQLKVNIDEAARDCLFIPMVIPTLVENIYRYGKLYDPLSPASLHIAFYQGLLCIETTNHIKAVLPAGEKTGHGIGLQNIRQRLELHYPGKYRFAYGREGEWFKVRLEVLL